MHNGESNINCHVLHISMCENLQYVGPLDDNQPPQEIVITYFKHYEMKISKFNLVNFLSTTNKNFLTAIVSGIFKRKKLISCIQAVCEMDMAYPWKKKQ